MKKWTIYNNKIPFCLLSKRKRKLLKSHHKKGGFIERIGVMDGLFSDCKPSWVPGAVYRAKSEKMAAISLLETWVLHCERKESRDRLSEETEQLLKRVGNQ